jgi:hypothetical protein
LTSRFLRQKVDLMEYVKIYFLIGLGLAIYSVLLELVIYDFGGLSGTRGFPSAVFFFVVNVLLWPLMLYAGRRRLNPFSQNARKEMANTRRIRRDMAERKRLLANPPKCTSVLRFDAGAILDGERGRGIFTFDAKDAEANVRRTLNESPRLQYGEEGQIANWLAGRNAQDTTPLTVPRIWSKFIPVADALVREGRGRVTCTECSADVGRDRLVYRDDHGQPGSNYNRILCPEGHALLQWVRIRLMG